MMVLLDIGSTLIDGPPTGPVRRLLQLLDLPPTRTGDIEQIVFRTSYDSPKELAALMAERISISEGRVLPVVEELWQAQLREVYLLSGARETVSRLAEAGIQRAYVSNIWPPFYHGFLRYFPEEAECCPCFPSFRVGLSKPDPIFYLTILEVLRVRPEEVVMLGDTYQNDIEPAIAIGMHTVWVLHRPDKELPDIIRVLNGLATPPSLSLTSIGDLVPEQVKRLCN